MTVCLCDYSIIIAIASSVLHYYTADLVLDRFVWTNNDTVYSDLHLEDVLR